MASQLEIMDSRKKAVIESKIMEVTAVLLLAFTLFTIPGFLLRYPTKVTAGQIVAQNHAPHDLNTASTRVLAAKSILFSTDKTTGKGSQVKYVSSMQATDRLIAETTEQAIIDNTADLAWQYLADAFNPDELSSHDRQLAHAVNHETIADTKTKENPVQDGLSLLFLPRVSSLPASELALIFPWKYTKPKSPVTHYVSAYASADINLINTPFDKLYSFASYTKEALNNSYGIHISGKRGNVEIETGLGYSARTYQPEIIKEAFGQFGSHYFEKSLQKISFDIACLPATIKYHFIDQPSWSAYLMGNVSINLIMNATYDIKETLVQGRPTPGRFTPDEARLDEKPFTEGLLNGGKLLESYFMTIGFGFGIQKNIINGISIYLQPSYNRHVLSQDIGIGPNKDKIHTSGIQMGIKAPISN